MLFATASITTGAFGVFEDNPLSTIFQEVLGESLPRELSEFINENYLEEIVVVKIPLPEETAFVDIEETPSTDVSPDINALAIEIANSIVAANQTATAQAQAAQQTQTAQSTATPEASASPNPAIATTPPGSQTPSPIPVWVAPTATSRPPVVCSTFKVNSGQTTGNISVGVSTIHKSWDSINSTWIYWNLVGSSGATDGTLAMTSSTLYYNPNDGFAGEECITYTMQNPTSGYQYSYKVHVIIANSPPTANLDTYTRATNPPMYQNSTSNTLTLLLNDTDPGNDPLTIISVDTTGLQGTASIAPDGKSVNYVPPSGVAPTGNPASGHGFTGDTSLTYTIQDSHGATSTNTANISVGLPPWCGSAVGDEGAGCVTSNINLNGIPQTNLTVTQGGSFDFQYDYQVWARGATWALQMLAGLEGTKMDCRDLHNGTNTPGLYPGQFDSSGVINMTAPATVNTYNIYINADLNTSCAVANYYGAGESIASITVNARPTAVADTAIVFENSSNNQINVLTNDSDPENDPFTITNIYGFSNGTPVASLGNTTIQYSPNASFIGTDNFLYEIADTYNGVDEGIVDVTIVGDCNPIAVPNGSQTDCEVENFSLSSNYVQPGDNVSLAFNYRAWEATCPTCSYQLLFGAGSNFSSCKSFSGGLGYLPGQFGIHNANITAPSTPGTYDIYANLAQTSTCSSDYYFGQGTPLGQLEVCGTVLTQTSTGSCYTGPSSGYPVARSLSDTTSWNKLTAYNDDYGSLWYELTESAGAWSCWIPSTMVTNTSGSSTNCTQYKYVEPLVLYRAGTFEGDLGDRTTIDTLCANNNSTNNPNAKGFIGHSNTYSIANLPTNYGFSQALPIHSTNQTKIADDWTDLLNGDIDSTLSAAGVTSAALWWSGAQSAAGDFIDGATANCDNWTSNLVSSGAFAGSGTSTAGNWIYGGVAVGCNQSYDLLCIAYP